MGSFNKHETTEGSRKIASLFDEGTFVEIGAYIKRGEDGKEYEGVVCGYGSVDGKLAFVFAQDSDRMKGAFDALHAKKIKMLYDMAVKNGAPVIGIFDSVGALVNEGVSSLAAYGTFMECVSQASGVIPQIAVISGVCSGMSAVVAAMFDMAITAKGSSQIYMSTADKAEGFCAVYVFEFAPICFVVMSCVYFLFTFWFWLIWRFFYCTCVFACLFFWGAVVSPFCVCFVCAWFLLVFCFFFLWLVFFLVFCFSFAFTF